MKVCKNKPEWLTNEAPWGKSVSIDCYKCNPEKIRSATEIERFTMELVQLIEMKAFGPCQIVNFGEDERVAGYSMVQLIETSCISGHFANMTNNAYIDIFSCKDFSQDLAAEFCKLFFQCERVITKSNERW